MPKQVKALKSLDVGRLIEPGRYRVGTVPGLMLIVKTATSRSWIFRTMVGTARKDIGLGGYPAVTLAKAIERARAALDDIRSGIDPVAVRKTKQEGIVWTFKACALAYIEIHKPSWSNAKHCQQWENTLETYTYPRFGHKHISAVTKTDVIDAIAPHWATKNETMVRVRNRIELIIDWAVARDIRPAGLNPAAWRGNVSNALPRPSKVNKRQHHRAVPIDAASAVLASLQTMHGTSIRCLELVVLTACRSGEARLATWAEFDLSREVWNIPGERTKSGRAQRVPLSSEALTMLEGLPRFKNADGTDVPLVFPGRNIEKPLSDMSLNAVMRRMKLDAVPHGWRSTFRDWAAERTSYPNEVMEMALGHAIGSGTEAAYRRGDLFEKRRVLMGDWAQFLTSAPAPARASGSNVIKLKAA